MEIQELGVQPHLRIYYKTDNTLYLVVNMVNGVPMKIIRGESHVTGVVSALGNVLRSTISEITRSH